MSVHFIDRILIVSHFRNTSRLLKGLYAAKDEKLPKANRPLWAQERTCLCQAADCDHTATLCTTSKGGICTTCVHYDETFARIAHDPKLAPLAKEEKMSHSGKVFAIRLESGDPQLLPGLYFLTIAASDLPAAMNSCTIKVRMYLAVPREKDAARLKALSLGGDVAVAPSDPNASRNVGRDGGVSLNISAGGSKDQDSKRADSPHRSDRVQAVNTGVSVQASASAGASLPLNNSANSAGQPEHGADQVSNTATVNATAAAAPAADGDFEI